MQNNAPYVLQSQNNSNQNKTADTMLHLWTAQTEAVLDSIRADGYSQVKTEYIDRKYGESAWIFKEAYGFFKLAAGGKMPQPPEGAQSPIWLFFDKNWVDISGGCRLLELQIPRERAILFHRERWNRVLNLAYVGRDPKEELDFEQKMERMGASGVWEIFQSGHYPYLKAEIKKSWNRIFETEGVEESLLGAAVWQLRREDIVKVDGETMKII